MLKNLVAFTLILLGIGTGLTLYLPDRNAVQIKPVDTFHVIYREETFEKPVAMDSLKYSRQVLSEEEKPKYKAALQIGLYSQLDDATSAAKSPQIKQLALPLSPTIFKAADTQRPWYIVSIGPFLSNEELKRYKQLLNQQQIHSQPIKWSLEDTDK